MISSGSVAPSIQVIATAANTIMPFSRPETPGPLITPPVLNVESVLADRTDLESFGHLRRSLFALQMDFGLEDVASIATAAVVDGGNDKSCDIFYFDDESGRAVICQAYEAQRPRDEAPAAKAADLNQAVSWMLTGECGEMRPQVAGAARELRDLLELGEVTALELWYVHNCDESEKVQSELDQAAHTARSIIDARYSGKEPPDVRAREIGNSQLKELYRSTQVAIQISDAFDVPAVGGTLRIAAEQWEAVYTSVPGAWLVGLLADHGESLFSANVRGYLGSKRSDRNINNGIKRSAATEPTNFWAFNNGVTALVNGFTREGDSLSISGVAIINGAQTTGSLLSADKSKLADVRVFIRFVHCFDPNLVRRIIRFNNRQNRVEAADFRSNDPIQERLRQEFEQLGHMSYSGGRRGGIEDVIRRPGDNQVPSSSAAQALAAFHGDPNLAYNQKSEIWESDATYSRLFNDRTSASHLYLVYTLLRTVEAEKLRLRNKRNLTGREATASAFLSRRGSIMLTVTAMAAVLETIVDGPILDRFLVSFRQAPSLHEALDLWRPLVDTTLAFSATLAKGAEQNMKRRETVEAVVSEFSQLFEASYRMSGGSSLDALRPALHIG